MRLSRWRRPLTECLSPVVRLPPLLVGLLAADSIDAFEALLTVSEESFRGRVLRRAKDRAEKSRGNQSVGQKV